MELQLKHQFLANENEREEAKSYFLEEFGSGETKSLRVSVGPYKDPGIEPKVEQYLNVKFKITESKVVESGLLFKKRTSEHVIAPMIISEETMNKLSNVFYDIILAFDVKVEIKDA
ncbi:MAG: hypothetical protein OQJ89_13840 [Kangiellaceae bacterium]|nr:hypothetical protein [Kangiellaceae bacterium]MCW9018047.1 hypothetical protein [Kangiellaceae bacterium]